MTRGDAINATFFQHPELYSQLFDTPHVGPGSMKRTSDGLKDTQVLATALRLVDFFEISLDLKDAIPEHAQGSWGRYMKTCLKNSQVLRNLIKNTPWYGDPIKDLCKEVEQDMRRFQPLTRQLQPISNILRMR